MVLLSTNFDNLHQVLRDLYNQMMPLCADMAGVAKGVAGIGAMFYVAYRVWLSLSRAEPIDVLPLLRPFVLGVCIMFFPSLVLGSMNSILSPIVKGTHSMLETQIFDLETLQREKDELEYQVMTGDPSTAWLVDNEAFDKELDELGISPSDLATMAGMYMERAAYNMKKWIRDLFREILELIFKAVSLLIDTLRTFFLIVLSILGPIAFALSVFDGFQNTLTTWIARYISVYLWLPVSDLFGSILSKIQQLMIETDKVALQGGTVPDSSDGVYIVFMIIGIIGYFTIPTVSSWIVQSGGAGAYMRNVNTTTRTAGNKAAGVAGATTGNVSGRLFKKG